MGTTLHGDDCRTTSETRIDDADSANAGIPQICQYLTDTARWQCTEELLGGGCLTRGRSSSSSRSLRSAAATGP